MANGGIRRGLYGEGRRTAVVAETHSPPHIQRSSLALVIEAGGGSEAGRGSEGKGESGNEGKNKKVSKLKIYFFGILIPRPRCASECDARQPLLAAKTVK